MKKKVQWSQSPWSMGLVVFCLSIGFGWILFHETTPFTELSDDSSVLESLRSLPKYDRPDLAVAQNFEMLRDPSTNQVQTARTLGLLKQIRSDAHARAIQGVSWAERGPDNIGGRTRALMFDPTDPTGSKVWAGGVAGGLWYNNDITSASTQWQNVDDFWSNLAISTLTFDPTNTQVFYAGTGEGFFNADAVRGAGIWKTTNAGATWSQLSSTDHSNFHHVQKVVVTPTGKVLAATRAGLFSSTDGGASWAQLFTGRFADIEVASNGDIYVSEGIFSSGVVRKSTNDAGSFTTVTPASGGERIELAIAPSDPATIYAVASFDSNVAWFRKSVNGGASWTAVAIPSYLDQTSCSATSTDFTRQQAWYDLILAVHPTNPNVVVVGGIDLHRSSNGGSSWAAVSYWTGSCKPYVHADQHAIVFSPVNANTAIFGNDGGVFYSSNIGSTSSPSFGERNNGYNVTQFYAADAANLGGSNYHLAGAQDNGSHQFNSSGVNSTTEVTGGDGAFCHIDQDNNALQLTSYVFNSYYRSTNGGSSFSSILSNQSFGRFINPTDYDDTGNNLYCGANADQYIRLLNIPGSITAQAIDVNLTGFVISAVKVSPHTANRIFVGTGTLGGDGGSRVFRIDNANGTPVVTQLSTSAMPADAYISCVEVGTSDNQLLVTYSNYGVVSVWETENGGSSWVNKEGNLPDIPVRWALYNPDNTNEVLLATELGVWSTDNIGVATPEWEVTNTGLANVRCDMLKYRDSDGQVTVATHGRGLFTGTPFSSSTPSECVAAISAFPYSESFESSLGAWSQNTSDDFDWIRDSGGTPSSGTGPASGSDGAFYAYVEASTPNNPSRSTILESPCFDLIGETGASFSFDYHMNGTDVGNLSLEARPQGGAWSSVWSRSGSQGNSWISEVIDLSSFSGAVIQIRFSGTTGAGWSGDMAVDNLELTTGPALVCDTPSGLASSGSTATSIDLDWTAVSGALDYDIELDGVVVASSSTNSAILSGLAPSTTYSIRVRSNCSSGSSAYSSAISAGTQAAGLTCATTASLPYTESFEAGFGAWAQGSGDDFNWIRRSGSTPSSNTGPTGASSGSFYVYVEASDPNYPSRSTILESPCFDLTGLSEAAFTFDYHMSGASNMGGLTLQAKSTDSGPWTTLWSLAGNQGTSWQSTNVDLSSYVGAPVRLRFVGTTASTWQGDIAIDNLSLNSGTMSSVSATLSITFDSYPEETSWELRDAGGTLVESGGPYGNQPAGSTIAINWTLSSGCYVLTFFDSFGDGICCSWGSGNYEVTSGGSQLASGGTFTSSQTQNFCLTGGGAIAQAQQSPNKAAEANYTPEFAIYVFPNPVKDKVTVHMSGIEEASYCLLTVSGTVLKTGSISGKILDLNMDELTVGVYFIQLQSGERQFLEKIIKK